jgi:hemerythrin-like domain-containing protein
MIEHRVVERMLALLDRENRRMAETGVLDPSFIRRAADFFETFVDRFHHGKEEEVFFRFLESKQLSPEDRAMMKQLIAEHALSRAALKEFKAVWDGNTAREELLGAATRLFETFMRSYPDHIDKEDRHFFPSAMNYLSDREQEALLETYSNFDSNFVMDIYRALLEELEA